MKLLKLCVIVRKSEGKKRIKEERALKLHKGRQMNSQKEDEEDKKKKGRREDDTEAEWHGISLCH